MAIDDAEDQSCNDLDADALLIAAITVGVPVATAARLIARYRDEVATLEGEPDWRVEAHMHGPGWGATSYIADGTQVSLTVWSEGKDRGERVYGIPGRQKGYATYREAVAALNRRSYRAGPRSVQEPSHGG